ncbi:MAG TPA: adenylate/guanylate cyclase domain-containing protein [Paracoccaceae bacterium]|nr:adenylate/guanylate cyclase domain-containing protein [Paracoccaceae bacterium]
MNVLWRGGGAGRARVLSGLVLFAFALTHFLNHGLGLFSTGLMEEAQAWRTLVTRSPAGTAILAAALLVHAALALGQLALKGTFRMPPGQSLQVLSGFAIPLLLLPHIVDTRMAAEAFGVRDLYRYQLLRLWGETGLAAQTLLLLLVWLHGCLGLHYWLRELSWWGRALPLLSALAALVPAFALAGIVAAGAREAAGAEPETLRAALAWPDAAKEAALAEWTRTGIRVFLALLGLTLAANLLRRLLALGRPIEISYVDGPKVSGRRGMTLLEISLANRVPHVALCGGKGRCTTCRVVVERGAAHLPPPGPAELATLAEIGSPKATRLACQVRPRGPVTVFRVFDVKRGRARAHASTGIERRMTVLFLDMRGFTARVSGKLPYDVVYLLNRFFDAVVPAVTERGGRIDKYLGDGFLAIFDLPGGPSPSCRAALEAVVAIDAALTHFNATLAQESQPALRIGMGLHVGALVQGEIGAAGHAPVTVIGDAVNTAARLENMTKLLSAQVLVSRPVLEAAGVHVPEAGWQRLDLRGVAGGILALPLRSGSELLPFLASARNHHAA